VESTNSPLEVEPVVLIFASPRKVVISFNGHPHGDSRFNGTAASPFFEVKYTINYYWSTNENNISVRISSLCD